jgi:N-acetylglucosamine-6-phosphate deacetylase
MKSLFVIQVKGFAGVDFQPPGLTGAELRRAVDALAVHQTLRFFATLITDDIEVLCAKLKNLERLRAADPATGAAICGYHLEGPWLLPRHGCLEGHDSAKMIGPDIRDFERLQTAAGGRIRLITLAPELPGSAEFIREVVRQGVQVALGHTNASADDIAAAITAGARFSIHFGSGIPEKWQPHDNVLRRLLARNELTAIFIPNGIQLSPTDLKSCFEKKPPGKALFTVNCTAAAGLIPRHNLPGGNLVVPDIGPDEGLINVSQWLGLYLENARAYCSTFIAVRFGVELPDLPPNLNDAFNLLQTKSQHFSPACPE